MSSLTGSPNALPPHPAQSGLLASHATGGTGVNCSHAYQVTGGLDQNRLVQAYEHALSQLDALRLVWSGPAAAHWQLAEAPRAVVRVCDLRDENLMADGRPGNVLLARVQRCADTPLDLVTGPLGVVEIWRTSAHDWVIIERFDHTVADGRSLALLHEAVSSLYTNPQEASVPFASYAAVLTGRSENPGSRAYWRRAFENFEDPPVSGLPSDGPAELQLVLPAPRVAQLQRAAGMLRGTLAAVLCTAHAHAVARHLGTGDIVTHVAVDGRDAQHASVFGQMTGMLPLRARHIWSLPVAEHARLMTRQLLEIREYADLPAESLDELGVPVSLSQTSATAFVMQPFTAQPLTLPDTSTVPIELRSSGQAGGLATVARQRADGSLNLHLTAPRGSRLAGLISSIGEIMDRTLQAIVATPDRSLGSDHFLPVPARDRIKALATPTPPYPFTPVDSSIIARLSLLGERPVLDDSGHSYSAAAVLRRIHRVAAQLTRAEVRTGDTVVVADLPVIDRIAAFVAVLSLGAVYLPLPSTPLPEGGLLVNAAARVSAVGVHRCTDPERGPRGAATPQSPAYVIFTSGSTGRPKGVAVSRASLANLVSGEADRFGIDSTSRVLLVAPPTADPWICHVAAALSAGATLVAGDPMSDCPLAEQMRAGRVSHAFLPAALLRTLGDRDFPDLRMIATAGDHCRAEDLRGFDGARVFNIYGPTEATVTATVAEITDPTDPVPVGYPIQGTGAQIMIDRAASAPPGAPGELVLTGRGIALGYLDDDKLTESVFGADPRNPAQRCYYTGDLARLNSDGQLILAGRLDRQIKIRGTRVELDAIEAAARTSGLCADAYAKAYRDHTSPDALLVLFVERCADTAALRQTLSAVLPQAALPHLITSVSALPRSASGKVTDELLPHDYANAASQSAARPHGSAAGRLAAIWTAVLGTPPRPDDNFFASGGDSLNALRLVRQAREAGLDFTPADVYSHPRYSDLDRLGHARGRHPLSKAVGSPEKHSLLGPAQHWLLGLGLPQPQHWNQRHTIGFQTLPDLQILRRAVTVLTSVTPVLRSRLDAEHRRLTVLPNTRVMIEERDGTASDEELAEALDAVSHSIDPVQGRMLAGLAVQGRHGEGCLVLVAHHLVVDIWSWQVIEDRLRRILAGAINAHDEPDQGFASFATAVARQTDSGAFDLDADLWRNVLASGATTALTERPTRLLRLARPLPTPQQLAQRWNAPASRILLAALGDALYAAGVGGEATVVDLERNGRTSASGLDLSSSVGWIALHHPVTVPHVPLTREAIRHVQQSVDEVPDVGISYGALRWGGRAALGDQVGRFAVDVSEGQDPSAPSSDLARRIRALPVSMTGANLLPYQGSFSFRQGVDGFSVVLDFDPDRLAPAQAEDILEAIGRAASERRPVEGAFFVEPASVFNAPVPASIMQRLMLHHAGRVPGAYVPRQVLRLRGVRDPDVFLDELSRYLGCLDAFRRRFFTDRGQVFQTWQASPLPIRRQPGGTADAVSWLGSDDRITSQGVLNGGPPAELTAFCGDSDLLLGLEVHHALLDGVSNRQLLQQIARFTRRSLDTAPHPAVNEGPRSRWVLRRHVSSEAAAGSWWPEPEMLQPGITLARPITHRVELPPGRMRRIGRCAARLRVDLRACVAAAAAAAAREALDITDLYVVANGRDVDVSGSADAAGMFWYFQNIPTGDGRAQEIASRVYAGAASPLAEVRAAAHRWPEWSDNAIAFKYTKEQSAGELDETVEVLASRDVFHFRVQVDVASRADGSGWVSCTATRAEQDALALLTTFEKQLAALTGEES